VGIEGVLVSAAALALSAMLTGVVRRFALARGILDVPNDRSSHRIVTPRGGGLAMVLATTASAIALAHFDMISRGLLFALLGGGIAVAAIGFMDDRRPVRAGVRLLVHFGAAIWAVAWIGAPALLHVGGWVINLGWTSEVLATLSVVWMLNLFNFMDGIDGIAASEAAFMGCGGAALMLAIGVSSGVAAVSLVLGGACIGFLLWNWPPAKIFMGDVGSGYLGYVIGVISLSAVNASPDALWTWLILGGVFFVDATLTLIRRTVRGDRVHEAHRSHAYQWLSIRWQSHKAVTLSVMAVNLLWLMPCAYFAAANPRIAAWIALVALTPLIGAAVLAGAGRPETR
jgi:Fuc2NAc and GlcNAc transferase